MSNMWTDPLILIGISTFCVDFYVSEAPVVAVAVRTGTGGRRRKHNMCMYYMVSEY